MSVQAVEYKVIFARQPTKYETFCRIDFAERHRASEIGITDTLDKIVVAVEGIEKNIVNQVIRHKILSKGNYAAARKITVNTTPIRQVCLNSFVYTYLKGKEDARKEIEASLRKRFRIVDSGRRVKLFDDQAIERFFNIAELKPEDALKQFRRRVPIKKSEYTRMLGRERNKAFTVAGVIEKDMIGQVQVLVDKAIDQGWGTREFSHALKQANLKYTGTAYGTDRLKGQPITPYHTETILRTNFADVYSYGRESMFNDPDVIEFVPAYQYSAILDTRTRATHYQMDGRIYARDDPIWDDWNPPNGYNCFPAGTLISVKRHGKYRHRIPIERMRIGDLVYTHLGNWKRVVEFHARLYKGNIIELKLENGSLLQCTPNHRILTKGGWKQASDVTFDDRIITLSSISAMKQWEDNWERRAEAAEWARVHLPIPKGTIRKPEAQRDHPCPNCGKIVHATVGDYHEYCSAKCAGIAGVYSHKLADNAAWKGGISFLPYTSEFTDELKKRIRKRDNNRCQLCGTIQGRKVVHHIDGQKDNSSPENLITLCDSCHGRVQFDENLNKKLVNQAIFNECFFLAPSEAIAHNPGIKSFYFEGPVYNLGVEDDESYMANRIAVHNCRCNKVPVTSNQTYSVSTRIAVRPDAGFGGLQESMVPARVVARPVEPIVTAQNVRKEIVDTYEADIQKINAIDEKALAARKRMRAAWDANDVEAGLKAEKEYWKLHGSAKRKHKNLMEGMRASVQVDPDGFDIVSVFKARTRTDFKTQVNTGVNEFTKLVSRDMIIPTTEGEFTVNVIRLPKYGRAYARTDNIAVAGTSGTDIVIHEMGHWLENNNPVAKKAALNFYNERTKGDRLEQLGRGFRSTEFTKKDKFIDSYMGKVYPNDTEIISMGLQYMYSDPYTLAKKDPGYFDFIWNLVRGR